MKDGNSCHFDSKSDEFLCLFRELEEELCSLSKFKDNYVSFSRALNQVHYDHLNPVVASSDVYEFLKTASDLRNLLSHRNDVAEPTDEFIERFRAVTKNIIYPTTCLDIATKGADILLCRSGDKVLEIVKLMNLRHLSHIPVYSDKNEFLGVFSRTSFFEYFSAHHEVQLTSSSTIKDLEEVIEISHHGNERYLFVSKSAYVIDVYRYLAKKKATDRRLSCIFVTKSGKSSEPLLGIITEIDILKVAVNME